MKEQKDLSGWVEAFTEVFEKNALGFVEMIQDSSFWKDVKKSFKKPSSRQVVLGFAAGLALGLLLAISANKRGKNVEKK